MGGRRDGGLRAWCCGRISTKDHKKMACKGKLPSAPLLARADDKHWSKDAWKGPVREAVLAAKLAEGTTAYTLRASVISDLVHDGLDVLTVAQISGTSTAMIERHYGHLRSEVAASALIKLALRRLDSLEVADVVTAAVVVAHAEIQ
jgi:integrase